MLERYKGDLKVSYKHFVLHPQAGTIPAHASCAAGLQGKFTEMYKLTWEKGFNAGRNFTRDNMLTLAREAGLNMSKFEADMDGECANIVRRDQADMGRVGTSGTPAFYINGRFISGAREIDQFAALIDEELKKANERIAKGEATVQNYYQKFVVEQGKKSLE